MYDHSKQVVDSYRVAHDGSRPTVTEWLTTTSGRRFVSRFMSTAISIVSSMHRPSVIIVAVNTALIRCSTPGQNSSVSQINHFYHTLQDIWKSTHQTTFYVLLILRSSDFTVDCRLLLCVRLYRDCIKCCTQYVCPCLRISGNRKAVKLPLKYSA